MKSLTANELRQRFLNFFQSKGHKIIASDSVVPKDDPTVLFTTAGMQQFKRQFLGHIDDFTRASTSQKCIRTDDLEEVGQTNFHHTFFEMLGNFSFGDYFKNEAIAWAWEFLTQELKIPPQRLWVSVYYDDAEAFAIWRSSIGIPEYKIFRLGDKSNFWPSNAKQNGPNGPCGPCSEIFFDYRPDDPTVPSDPDDIPGRFAEIWNLVFTQFNRKDGGELEPLPSKNIDTGMGLERLCAVIQGVESNFDTNLFVPIIDFMSRTPDLDLVSSRLEQRIIADHIRAAAFAINDGIIPSNKERGSVVKNLINRSINLVLQNGGRAKACVYQLVAVIADIMKDPYPDLLKKSEDISGLIKKAEESFIIVWQTRIPELRKELASATTSEERGRLYFLYHDTHGLPLNTILSTAQGAGFHRDNLANDLKVYERLMNEQRERSRANSKIAADVFTDMDLDLNLPRTRFLGYETLTAEADVLRIFQNQQTIESASAGQEVRIVLDQTPFYAESGGQIGDTGLLTTPAGCVVEITDTQKLDDIFLHQAVIREGQISTGDRLTASVDTKRRLAIMRNHTATHLLQAALRKILGEHVQQQGSDVDDKRLRFDFTHPHGLTDQQKTAVEDEVNRMVQQNIALQKREMSIAQAREQGALAFFAEKYGQTVRVIQVPGCSTELCGGTHLDATGEIKHFKISSEGAIAQGIRRIEAVTANHAETFLQMSKQKKHEADEILKKKEQEKRTLKETFQKFKEGTMDGFFHKESIQGSQIVITIPAQSFPVELMKQCMDFTKQTLTSGVMIFGTSTENTATILVAVTDDLIQRGINASDIIKKSAPVMDGRGGGKPSFAQAGGKMPEKLPEAIEAARTMVTKQLS